MEGWAGGAGNRSTAAPQRRQPIGCQDPLSRYVRRREIDQEAYPGYPGREDGTLDPTGRSITQATSGQNGGWPGPTRAQQELPRPVPNQMFSGRAPAACRAAGPGPNLCLRGANSTVVFLHGSGGLSAARLPSLSRRRRLGRLVWPASTATMAAVPRSCSFPPRPPPRHQRHGGAVPPRPSETVTAVRRTRCCSRL